MKVICSSEESLYRPEAVRWRQRMEWMKPVGDSVVLLPCSMKKPYSNSKSHQAFRKVTRSFQELIVTSPFGICPRELENTFPIQSYDVSTTGSWSQDEIRQTGQLIKKYCEDETHCIDLNDYNSYYDFITAFILVLIIGNNNTVFYVVLCYFCGEVKTVLSVNGNSVLHPLI